MSCKTLLASALGAALLATPVVVQAAAGPDDGRIILAQAGGGGGDSGGTGGLSGGTPGSPAAGNLGSTPQEMLGRSQQPAQGAATTLAPTTGRGAPDPSALPGTMETAPGGTAVMPGDRTRR
ncbi:hypothetical protein [Paracraurococcus lichenis]|uniref:Uncharacterized protein n=1 Tax=Paracraurococcus lichenis TaxID=3064888 RepID=A0ABT9E2B8_9PROT|nr:hypothetical protein [Paracraurococcus sp. LOR1-02]MDO9710316.1 hypothetical protein [Paracraurococcus sp. LOR1-02]